MTRSSSPARSSPARRGLIALLFVLTCIGITLSTITVWAHQTVLGTDRFVAAVSRIAADPDVQAAAATRLSSQIVEAADVQGRISGILPPAQSFLAAPLANAVEGFLDRRLATFMASERAQAALVTAIRVTHERLLRVLRSESDFVSIEGNTVTVDLLPIAVEGLRTLQEQGVLPATITLPDVVDPAGREAAIARLESTLGRDLPDDFATLSVADANRLAGAQAAVRAFDIAVIVILAITLFLVIATLFLARRRLRMVVALGLGAVVALALARLLVRGAVNGLSASLAATNGGTSVIDDVVQGLITDLAAWSWILIVLGVIVAFTAALVSRPEWLTSGAEAVGGPGASRGDRIGAWFRRHAQGIAWSVAIILTVILLWIATSPELAILVGVGLVVVAVSGVGSRRSSDDRSAAQS